VESGRGMREGGHSCPLFTSVKRYFGGACGKHAGPRTRVRRCGTVGIPLNGDCAGALPLRPEAGWQRKHVCPPQLQRETPDRSVRPPSILYETADRLRRKLKQLVRITNCEPPLWPLLESRARSLDTVPDRTYFLLSDKAAHRAFECNA